MEAMCQMASYERSLRSVAGEVSSKGWVQSLTSSLSNRGIRRDEAMDFANVLFPLPGCPFIAIITADSNFAISSFTHTNSIIFMLILLFLFLLFCT